MNDPLTLASPLPPFAKCREGWGTHGVGRTDEIKSLGHPSDFNGDGKDDLVLSDGSDVFVIYYSRGDGTFYQSTLLSLGGQVQAGAFEVGDFNGDGRPDLAISLYPTNEVAMFFNQPGGQFTLSYFVSGPGGYDMRVGDLNGDGKLDLAVEPYPPLNPPTIAEVVFHQ